MPAPKALKDLRAAIDEAPDTIINGIDADPTLPKAAEVTSAIGSLDENLHTKVWKRIQSAPLREPLSVDAATIRLIALLEDKRVNKQSISPRELFMFEIIVQVALARERSRAGKNPDAADWRRVASIAREITRLKVYPQFAQFFPDAPYKDVAEIAIWSSKRGEFPRTAARTRFEIVQTMTVLSMMFNEHLGKPFDSDVAKIVACLSGAEVTPGQVKMNRTRQAKLNPLSPITKPPQSIRK